MKKVGKCVDKNCLFCKIVSGTIPSKKVYVLFFSIHLFSFSSLHASCQRIEFLFL